MSRAQQNSTGRRRLVPAALGFGLVLALAGCGAGQVTQTDTQVAAVNGASGQAGTVGVRDAQLAFPPGATRYYPKGSDAALVATIVNDGSSVDRLVSISSPAATSVNLQGSTVIPAGFAVSAVAGEGSQGTTTSSAPTSSTSPTSTSTPGTTGQATGAPSTATGSATALPVGKISVTLTGLTRDVRPGETIRVTLVFEHAGQVSLDVPIASPTTNPRP